MLADIFVVAVVAAFVAAGYRAGLMRALIRVVAYLISVVVSFMLYPVLSEFLMKTDLYTMLVEAVNKNYVSKGFSETEGATLGVLSKYFSAGMSAAADGISQSVAGLLINVIAFVLILILSRLVVKLIEKLLNIVTHLPVIRHFNRLGGAVFGGAAGILILYAVFAVIVLFVPFKNGDRVMAEIEKSSFASEMYENNILLNLIEQNSIGGLNGKI